MRSLTLLLAMAIVATIAGMTAVASADATVYVVHGIPDAVLDVALDGECVLSGAAFADQAGPMDIPAGIHQITVSLANPTAPCTGEIVLDIPVQLVDRENVTAVAFLDDTCQPTVARFDNNFSRTSPGKARVVLHHTACAPAMDIAVARDMNEPFSPMVEDFSNGDQIVQEIRPGEWYVWLAEAGTGVPSVGPTLVKVKPFTTYRAFAIGSVLHGNATLVVFEDKTR